MEKTMIKVIIAGRPITGKSTLFNALTGTRDALVHDRPGVTRDIISGTIPDRPIEIFDTAGLENAKSGIALDSTNMAVNAIASADAVLFVVDGRAGLTPMDITPNSSKKVWWKCSLGHEWETAVTHRSRGSGCPYCSGQRILKGYNDLQTINPDLASEWNYEKNGSLKPTDITANNGKKVWWKCSKGHEWQAKIYHRNNGSNCPVCQSERNTSLPEYALVYYLRKSGIEVIHSYKELGYELDVYIYRTKCYNMEYWIFK